MQLQMYFLNSFVGNLFHLFTIFVLWLTSTQTLRRNFLFCSADAIFSDLSMLRRCYGGSLDISTKFKRSTHAFVAWFLSLVSKHDSTFFIAKVRFFIKNITTCINPLFFNSRSIRTQLFIVVVLYILYVALSQYTEEAFTCAKYTYLCAADCFINANYNIFTELLQKPLYFLSPLGYARLFVKIVREEFGFAQAYVLRKAGFLKYEDYLLYPPMERAYYISTALLQIIGSITADFILLWNGLSYKLAGKLCVLNF